MGAVLFSASTSLIVGVVGAISCGVSSAAMNGFFEQSGVLCVTFVGSYVSW